MSRAMGLGYQPIRLEVKPDGIEFWDYTGVMGKEVRELRQEDELPHEVMRKYSLLAIAEVGTEVYGIGSRDTETIYHISINI
jgi:hypothetical protein|tara:strand:+ start:1020 stop:1265 length:246 start_codon:yes stop_codon:yes gene_type:complete